MKSTFFSILMLCVLCGIKSQQTTFAKVLGNDTIDIFGNSFVPTCDNGCVIAGGMSNNGLLVNLDASGGIIWQKSFEASSLNQYSDIKLNAVNRTVDSCYIIVGSAYDSSLKKFDGLVMKISFNGTILWSKIIRGDIQLFSVQQTYDSSYVVTGNHYGLSTSQYTVNYKSILVAKLDVSGNLKWSKTFTAGNFFNYCNSIKQTADSNYLVAGRIGYTNPYDAYFFLMKLSASGNILWSKKYQRADSYSSEIADFLVLPDGYLIYGGISLIKTNFVGDVK